MKYAAFFVTLHKARENDNSVSLHLCLLLLLLQWDLSKLFGLKTNDVPPFHLFPTNKWQESPSLGCLFWKISSFDSRHELGVFTDVAGHTPPFLEL